MSRSRFIQAVVVRSLPALEKAEAVVEYAERLWEVLTRRGYGAPHEAKPRQRVDWHGRLSAEQQAAFGKFWLAYGHKKGRNEAAMAWYEIDPPAAEHEWIYASAAAEARAWRDHPPQGVIRIYPQGWLSGYRWRDQPRPEPADGRQMPVSKASPGVQKSNLLNEMAHLKTLQERLPNAAVAARIAAIEERIRELG
jgi:hypothetical protein